MPIYLPIISDYFNTIMAELRRCSGDHSPQNLTYSLPAPDLKKSLLILDKRAYGDSSAELDFCLTYNRQYSFNLWPWGV